MEVKLNKTKNKKENKIKKRTLNKIRLAIIFCITIILIISLFLLVDAYQKPETIKTKIITVEYTQIGKFNYIAYLNNSTVYEGKEILTPFDEIIFKQITKNINATFFYSIITSKNTEIYGNYTITAEIQTELWNKSYIILSKTPFNATGFSTTIYEQFPIDYNFYENITKQIENETDITVNNPMLIITADIKVDLKTAGETISTNLAHNISVTLDKKTIDIEENPNNTVSENITKTEESINKNIINQKNNYTISSSILFVVLLLFIILTRRYMKLTKIEKEINKIKKKYGEWIVDVKLIPKKSFNTEIITIENIDDLMKISEQLSKPVIHYQEDKNIHTFYVSENLTCYQYYIKDDKENQ